MHKNKKIFILSRISQTKPKVCYEELLLQCFSVAYETEYNFNEAGNASTQNFTEEHDALTIIMMILGIRKWSKISENSKKTGKYFKIFD